MERAKIASRTETGLVEGKWMGKSVHRSLKAQKSFTELTPIQSSDVMRLFLFIAI